MIGKVKKILTGGCGFIHTNGEDFFFHYSEYKGDWESLKLMSPPNVTEGPDVLFTPVDHTKGPRAIKVELIKKNKDD